MADKTIKAYWERLEGILATVQQENGADRDAEWQRVYQAMQALCHRGKKLEGLAMNALRLEGEAMQSEASDLNDSLQINNNPFIAKFLRLFIPYLKDYKDYSFQSTATGAWFINSAAASKKAGIIAENDERASEYEKQLADYDAPAVAAVPQAAVALSETDSNILSVRDINKEIDAIKALYQYVTSDSPDLASYATTNLTGELRAALDTISTAKVSVERIQGIRAKLSQQDSTAEEFYTQAKDSLTQAQIKEWEDNENLYTVANSLWAYLGYEDKRQPKKALLDRFFVEQMQPYETTLSIRLPQLIAYLKQEYAVIHAAHVKPLTDKRAKLLGKLLKDETLSDANMKIREINTLLKQIQQVDGAKEDKETLGKWQESLNDNVTEPDPRIRLQKFKSTFQREANAIESKHSKGIVSSVFRRIRSLLNIKVNEKKRRSFFWPNPMEEKLAMMKHALADKPAAAPVA